jgi:hypothetical protein
MMVLQESGHGGAWRFGRRRVSACAEPVVSRGEPW